jgi:flagellar hook-length control protein FliK
MSEMPVTAVLPPVRPSANASTAKPSSPEPSTASATNSATGKPESAANSSNNSEDKPFAAVLKQQQKAQQSDAQAIAKAAATAANPVSTEFAPTTEVAPADSLAALIPLLAAQQGAAAATDKSRPADAEKSTEATPTDGSLIAALVPAVPVTPPNENVGNKTQTAPSTGTPTEGQTLAFAENKPATTAANLAATDISAKTDTAKTVVDANTTNADFTAALAVARQANEQAARAAGPTSSSEMPQARVETPMGAAGWANEMGDKMSWMASGQISKAELVLNPPHMGRIEVSLSINGDQATAQFVSANPQVRETIEASLPRLREVLADAGVSLGQTFVGSEAQNQSSAQGDSGDNRRANSAGDFAANLPDDMRVVRGGPTTGIRRGSGMLDVFA